MTDFIDRRLKVTVSGPRGAGKTNLTLAIARMLTGYADQGLRADQIEAAPGDKDAAVALDHLNKGGKVETADRISVIMANVSEEIEPREVRTVGQLIEALQRLPAKAEVIGGECKPLKVVPQTTGAILING
ncbi:hypothetical protein BAJUN_02210 [Bajunvirus bajun]|uniref:Uncharacterized protein n=1 Tax=Brevundimonas phage vB_BgoS-Bajun TaxID=2948594 RepID=A0A9E7N7T9_9CAUD|nr:hypothetical protein BAJUN_02210 [Brevundimonas phage vB_BgoS-Bajun]